MCYLCVCIGMLDQLTEFSDQTITAESENSVIIISYFFSNAQYFMLATSSAVMRRVSASVAT